MSLATPSKGNIVIVTSLAAPSSREEKLGAPSPAEFRRTADYLCDQMRMSAHALQLDIPPSDICRRLRAALENAHDDKSLDALREVVCEFTALLREKGASPESVLVSLKAVINIHALPPRNGDDGARSGYKILERITGWAIEEYFGEEKRKRA